MEATALKLVLRSYDHRLLDQWAAKLVALARDKAIAVSGPVPFPVKRKVFTTLRSVHTDKDSREQFELRVHKRLLVFKEASQEDLNDIFNMRFPEGIHVAVKR